ncbi:DegT/DnrJ/EryC1/StrS family aminotransferase [Tritonibacter aquimaris]|nr:DegT/DnrJ/EryC1/StrS family aminotransferase [Tritonibacter aquimaris]
MKINYLEQDMYVIRRPPVTLAGEAITQEDRDALAQWIAEGGNLQGDAELCLFETALAQWLGARHVVMVNSGASANLLMLNALKPRLRNRRVVLAELGRASTIAPLMQLGFDPYLCPCDPEALSPDLAALEALFRRERPALLLMHHILGVPGDMEAVAALCARHDVVLLEDARDALGGQFGGRLLGRFGTAASYSLRRVLGCLDGGVVVSDDAELVKTMRRLRGTPVGTRADRAQAGDFDQAGFSMHAGEITAFLGNLKLGRIEQEAARRSENHAIYQRELARYYQQKNDQAVICGSGFGTLVANPDETAEFLRQNRIESQPMLTRHIAQLPFWQQKYGATAAATQMERCGMVLPLHGGLDAVEIVRIAELFKQVAQPIMPAASTAQSVQA